MDQCYYQNNVLFLVLIEIIIFIGYFLLALLEQNQYIT